MSELKNVIKRSLRGLDQFVYRSTWDYFVLWCVCWSTSRRPTCTKPYNIIKTETLKLIRGSTNFVPRVMFYASRRRRRRRRRRRQMPRDHLFIMLPPPAAVRAPLDNTTSYLITLRHDATKTIMAINADISTMLVDGETEKSPGLTQVVHLHMCICLLPRSWGKNIIIWHRAKSLLEV